MEEVNDPHTGSEVNVHWQIWSIMNNHQQYLLFKNSDHYQNFKNDHNGVTAACTIWRLVLERLNTVVSKPKPGSCVDEKINGLEHKMASLLCVGKRPHVKSHLENFSCTGGHNCNEIVDILCEEGEHRMIESACCPKVEQPDLHVDKTKSCPTSSHSSVHMVLVARRMSGVHTVVCIRKSAFLVH